MPDDMVLIGQMDHISVKSYDPMLDECRILSMVAGLMDLHPSIDRTMAASPTYDPVLMPLEIVTVSGSLPLEHTSPQAGGGDHDLTLAELPSLHEMQGLGTNPTIEVQEIEAFIQQVTRSLNLSLIAQLPYSPKSLMARIKKKSTNSSSSPVISSERLKSRTILGKTTFQLASEVLAKKLGVQSSSVTDNQTLVNSYVQKF